MAITYGIEAQTSVDKYIELAERANTELEQASIPGSFLVVSERVLILVNYVKVLT
jgi:hypothetical protein